MDAQNDPKRCGHTINDNWEHKLKPHHVFDEPVSASLPLMGRNSCFRLWPLFLELPNRFCKMSPISWQLYCTVVNIHFNLEGLLTSCQCNTFRSRSFTKQIVLHIVQNTNASQVLFMSRQDSFYRCSSLVWKLTLRAV